jgi:hypothetical protein
MSTRLQVVLDDEELAEIRRAARAQRMTVSEWVRQTLRRARESDATGDAAGKVAAVRAAARHGFPTADIDQMLEEIAAGYDAPAT